MTIVYAVQSSPVAWPVARSYLLSRPEIAGIVGDRVKPIMPTTFPGLRVTELSTSHHRRWSRAYLQIDCWHTNQHAADALAQTVMDVFTALGQYVTGAAVLTADDDWTAAQMPDATVTVSGGAPQPRTIVTGHVFIHPQP